MRTGVAGPQLSSTVRRLQPDGYADAAREGGTPLVLRLLMSPLFWLVLHSVICVIALALALNEKLWWTAGMAIAGAVLGAVLAVVPLWMMMSHYTNETGYGAGNAGIFFCCTVPLFPPLGLALGIAGGYAIDLNRRGEW